MAQEAGFDGLEPQQEFQSPVAKNNDWTPLDDEYNMVDENSIPRDFYVDKPATAQYIPDQDGNDKAI